MPVKPDQAVHHMGGEPVSTPLTDVRDISRIAYGFMGSKALFSALNIDLFGHLAGGGKTLEALVEATGVASNRLSTLLAALTSIGLIVRQGNTYRNAPASDRYLVRAAPAYFGDYYRFQIDRQIYPALAHLDAGIAGDTQRLAFDSLGGLTGDPEEAEAFTRAQHAGSMGPAVMLARNLDLAGARRLLDVGGGSGAFSIALCQRNPELRSTVLDFPNVIDVAERFVSEAKLGDRIDTIRSDAIDGDWPSGQDVVLFSYLLSAVAESSFPLLLDKAWEALRPGGRLLIHDFMLDDDETGPALAALWFLQYLSGRIDGVSFSAATLSEQLKRHGYDEISDQVVIPEITKLVVCAKPA
jgi:ubiquinone/menaquinone biosynthesis C-methylase UbiE